MELEYFGGNCVRISTKHGNFITDDNLTELGLKSIAKPGDVKLFTTPQPEEKWDGHIFDAPGEYEVSNVSIQGTAAQGFSDEANTYNNVIYRLVIDDTRIAVVGSVNSDLTDDELEAIGTVDILCIPIGGGGITPDGINALKIIKKIEPKLVVPTYYAEKGVTYEAGLLDLDASLKELSMEPVETVDKLKLKGRDFTDTTQLIVIKRQ